MVLLIREQISKKSRPSLPQYSDMSRFSYLWSLMTIWPFCGVLPPQPQSWLEILLFFYTHSSRLLHQKLKSEKNHRRMKASQLYWAVLFVFSANRRKGKKKTCVVVWLLPARWQSICSLIFLPPFKSSTPSPTPPAATSVQMNLNRRTPWLADALRWRLPHPVSE